MSLFFPEILNTIKHTAMQLSILQYGVKLVDSNNNSGFEPLPIVYPTRIIKRQGTELYFT